MSGPRGKGALDPVQGQTCSIGISRLAVGWEKAVGRVGSLRKKKGLGSKWSHGVVQNIIARFS